MNFKKQAEAPGTDKCTILDELRVHTKAIQSLIKEHGQPKNVDKQGSQVYDGKECGNSSSLLAIAQHAKNINTIIDGRNNPVTHLTSSSLLLRKIMENQAVTTGPRYRALNNSLVLRTIMSHMDAPTLLRGRLVSKTWKQEATAQLTSALRANENHQVIFRWTVTTRKFESKAGTLSTFTQSFFSEKSPSRKFPCSFFWFENIPGNVVDGDIPPDLSRFLSEHGHLINSIKLNTSNPSSQVLSIFRTSIFEWTPNLRFLTLQFPVSSWFPSRDEPSDTSENQVSVSSRPTLVNLHELNFENMYDDQIGKYNNITERSKALMTDILLSAPNLKNVSDPYLFFNPEVIAAGKSGTVHYIDWDLDLQEVTPRFVQFLETRPQLYEFYLKAHSLTNRAQCLSSNFSQSLQRLLQSSQKSLKFFSFSGRLDLDTTNFRMEVPVLENVQELQIYAWSEFRGGRGRFLPEGLNLQDSFPTLKTLWLEGLLNRQRRDEDDSDDEDEESESEEEPEEEDQNAGENDNPLCNESNASTTLEKLHLQAEEQRSVFHPDWLSQAIVLYPNVRVLELTMNRKLIQIPQILGALWRSWRASSLEELRLKLFMGPCGVESRYEIADMVDQTLTGFDQETCQRLRSQLERGEYPGEGHFERGPSIFDMRKLKLVDIFLQMPRNLPVSFPFFSRLSVIYAWESMRERQGLKVTFCDVSLEQMIQDPKYDL